jgi:hypothetical protein
LELVPQRQPAAPSTRGRSLRRTADANGSARILASNPQCNLGQGWQTLSPARRWIKVCELAVGLWREQRTVELRRGWRECSRRLPHDRRLGCSG